MEIRHLKSFRTIVELGSFGRAAEQLGYAQSTVTTHIQAIEDELGAPVFNRLGKKNILTENGKTFLPYAIKMLELYSISTEISSSSDIPSGNLTIGSTESLIIHKLFPIINEFTLQHPKVNISLKSGDGDKLRNFLRTGEIDIALLLEFESADHIDLHIETQTHEPMVFIEPNNNQLRNLYNKNAQNTILFTQNGCSFRSIFENYLKENNIPIKSTLEFISVESIKESIQNGHGISLLPLFAVQPAIEQGKVSVLPWSTKEVTVTTLLAYHKNKWLSSAMKAFIELMKQRNMSYVGFKV